MNISKILNLNITGHKNIDFIDIDETLDTGLYIDPYVIQALSNDFCKDAKKCIDSFFIEIFNACKAQNHAKLKRLLAYASEPNETNLGMKSISNYGKGATSLELTKIFIEFYKTVRKNPHIASNPLALCMYIKNFDKDKMSDLITNIIRRQLYIFTAKQLDLWGKKLTTKESMIGYYWDYSSLTWKKLIAPPLIIGNNNILLVPKSIVRTHYVFNVECYIKQYILSVLQEKHVSTNSDMCTTKEYKDGSKKIIPPSKKELYKLEVNGKPHKGYAFTYSSNNKSDEDDFIKDIHNRIKSGYGSLDDSQLDNIVYRKYKDNSFKAS